MAKHSMLVIPIPRRRAGRRHRNITEAIYAWEDVKLTCVNPDICLSGTTKSSTSSWYGFAAAHNRRLPRGASLVQRTSEPGMLVLQLHPRKEACSQGIADNLSV